MSRTRSAATRTLLVMLLTISAHGCGKHGDTQSPAVATVGGKPISQSLFNYFVTQKTGLPAEQVSAAHKAALLEDLKRLTAAAEAGEARPSSDTIQALELQRLEMLAHAAASAAGAFAPPTERELRTEYERFIAELPATQYHVAHILVSTQDAAAALIAKLQAGADFATLAREQSADTTRTQGGDMGWIAPGKLPPPFTDAAQSLKPGEFTRHPVHTIYGWHVIKVLESRAAAVPPFEQVKAQLSANLQQSRYQHFLAGDSDGGKMSVQN
jgi:peptidyl-prolyl cis-trans isomerase C